MGSCEINFPYFQKLIATEKKVDLQKKVKKNGVRIMFKMENKKRGENIWTWGLK